MKIDSDMSEKTLEYDDLITSSKDAFDNNNYEKAFKYSKYSISVANNDDDIGLSYFAMARCKFGMTDYTAAADLFEKSFEFDKQLKQNALTKCYLGALSKYRGDYMKALEYFQDVVKGNAENIENDLIAYAKLELGKIQYNNKITDSLKMLTSIDMKYLRSEYKWSYYFTLAEIYNDRNEIDHSIKTLKEALNYSKTFYQTFSIRYSLSSMYSSKYQGYMALYHLIFIMKGVFNDNKRKMLFDQFRIILKIIFPFY